MTELLFVIANNNIKPQVISDLILMKMQGNCTVWIGPPISSELYETGLTFKGPGILSNNKKKSEIDIVNPKRIRDYPVLISRALQNLLWAPIHCAWQLNFGKNALRNTTYDYVMAADPQATLALWFFGRKNHSAILWSKIKAIS